MPKSFFEKLKKGMGIEIPQEELKEEKEEKEEKEPKRKKRKIIKKLEMKTTPIEEKKVEIKKPLSQKPAEPKEEWFEPEGQLSVDVYQTENELIIQSAVAGVKTEDLNISMEGDMIAIRGVREKPFNEEGDYFTQECYWGPFSREIILPVEVDPNKVEASLKEGILTIRIPKLLKEKRRKIAVKKLI